mmetsp:Transcript_17293/g.48720  ORF Transcript_17293/g.48720 Transcript_17293/m.48720 type:complete len:208 (-) Transcript_17293:193-816(-)
MHTFLISAFSILSLSLSLSLSHTQSILFLLSQLQEQALVALDLLLELQQSKEKCLGGWRTSWHVNIDWDDAVASSDHGVRVMVVPASVGAGSHGQHPSRLWHLIVHLSQGRCHLVGEGPGDDHHVRLARGRTEHHAESVHVISRCGGVHHFDGAARQTEGHGPQRTLSRPVDQLVDLRYGVLHVVLDGHLIQPAGSQTLHIVQAPKR